MCIVGSLVGDPGNVLRWDADYHPGDTVGTNTQVYDAGWAMVSNKPTSQRAAVQPVGSPFYVYDGTPVNQQASAKQIIFGNRYTLTQAGYLNGFRINAIAGNEYGVYSIFDPLGVKQVTLVASFTASESGFVTFGLAPTILLSGTVFDLVAYVREPDPTPTVFSGDWDYAVQNNVTTVANGQIRQDGQDPQRFLISKTDFNAGDRSAELATMTLGDTISGVGVLWAIQSIIDNGTFYTFILAPALTGAPAGVSEFTFETTTATPITYSEDVDYWLSNPDVQGLLGIDTDYENIVPNETAYGTDILVQYADVPTDWDIVAYSGAGGGGGTTQASGLSGNVQLVTFGQFDSFVPQNPTGLGAAGVIKMTFGAGGNTTGGEFTIAPSGIITTLKGGVQYRFDLVLRLGRTSAAGISEVMGRLMYAEDGIEANGTQVGGSFSVEIDDPNTIWREEFNINIRPETGSLIWFEMARNNGSNNSGGLLTYPFNGDLSTWNPTPTASLTIGILRLV